MSRIFIISSIVIAVLVVIGGAAEFVILRGDRAEVRPPAAREAAASRVAAAPSEVGETVFLTVREPAPGNAANHAPDLLHRELMRQAFLIAARDELGLSTRDVLLREDFPEQPDARSLPFEMYCGSKPAQKNDDLEFLLSRPKSGDNPLWRFSINLYLDDPASLPTLVEKAEAFSRGELKDALTAAGGKGTVPAHRASADVPEDVSDLLWSWNEISVLGGVRRVHAAIREKGQSPELLAALAIGYVNLGSLTEYQYSAAYKAYYARGLLYAERLVRETNQSPWALWHRAYARMQVGLHKFAADDIAAAKAKLAATSAGKPLPFWTEVLEAFAQGDPPRMLKLAKTPAAHRLALYFNLQAVLFGDLEDLTIDAARQFLGECPDCARCYDVLVASRELGPAREGAYSAFDRTGEFLRKRLPAFPGVPRPTVGQIEDAEVSSKVPAEIAFRTGLAANLKAAGAPGLDRGEPSLSALGHLIEEIDFAQVLRRLEFDAHIFGIPTDETVAKLGPLCAAHPYAAYVASFQQRKEDKERGAAQLVKKLEVPALTFKQRPLLQWLGAVTRSPEVTACYDLPKLHGDTIFSDLLRDINAGEAGGPDDPRNEGYLWMLTKTSDKLPIVVAFKIHRDWAHVEHDAASLERAHGDDPFVMKAFANRYYRLKRYDDAERCAKRLTEIHRGFASYRLLANVYKAKKDDARWQATLEKSLELPDQGLQHAQIQNEIALDLMEHKQLKEAVVYADTAAQSYSEWSMQTAGRCHELLGEWDEAERLFHAISERYEDGMEKWAYWCHRTGHGDVRAADEFLHAKLEALGTSLYASQSRDVAHYYLLTNDPEQALVHYRRALETAFMPYAALHAALILDRLGKTAERDALLKQITDTNLPENSTDGGTLYYRQLSGQFQLLLAVQGAKHDPGAKVDLAEVDKILDAAPAYGVSEATLPYFVGIFLKTRGDLETAKKYLIRAAQSKDWIKLNNVLACQLLREMKVEVPPASDASKPPAPSKAPEQTKPK